MLGLVRCLFLVLSLDQSIGNDWRRHTNNARRRLLNLRQDRRYHHRWSLVIEHLHSFEANSLSQQRAFGSDRRCGRLGKVIQRLRARLFAVKHCRRLDIRIRLATIASKVGRPRHLVDIVGAQLWEIVIIDIVAHTRADVSIAGACEMKKDEFSKSSLFCKTYLFLPESAATSKASWWWRRRRPAASFGCTGSVGNCTTAAHNRSTAGRTSLGPWWWWWWQCCCCRRYSRCWWCWRWRCFRPQRQSHSHQHSSRSRTYHRFRCSRP